MSSLLVLGAGYIGAALADQALAVGHDVMLADNWYATEREQLAGLEERGAMVQTADLRDGAAVDALLGARPDRVFLLAAQASRPLSESDPEYTEETNVSGVRKVAQAAAAHDLPVVFASSLHVYGPDLEGEVTAEQPYGPQGDLAHLSKVYGELCLALYARRAGLSLDILRLGLVYGPSPVEHSRPESQTVVDKFRRLAAEGEPLTVAAGGTATIGVVHVEDAARVMLELGPEPGVRAAYLAAESVTVADVAALAEGRPPAGGARCTFATPFSYRLAVADYLRP